MKEGRKGACHFCELATILFVNKFHNSERNVQTIECQRVRELRV